MIFVEAIGGISLVEFTNSSEEWSIEESLQVVRGNDGSPHKSIKESAQVDGGYNGSPPSHHKLMEVLTDSHKIDAEWTE